MSNEPNAPSGGRHPTVPARVNALVSCEPRKARLTARREGRMPSLQGLALDNDGLRREGILPSLRAPARWSRESPGRRASRHAGKAECLPSKGWPSTTTGFGGKAFCLPCARQRAGLVRAQEGAPHGAQGRQNAFPPRAGPRQRRASEGRHPAFPARASALVSWEPKESAPSGTQGRQNAFPPRAGPRQRRASEGRHSAFPARVSALVS